MKAQAFKCTLIPNLVKHRLHVYHRSCTGPGSRVLECGVQPAGDNMFLLWLLLADTGDLASLARCVRGVEARA